MIPAMPDFVIKRYFKIYTLILKSISSPKSYHFGPQFSPSMH